jgi:hypothetical protein
MSGIDIFSWVVLLVMIATVVVVFVVLGMLPGKIARQRQHPQAQAIQVASWLALIFGFIAWPFVLVWAYRRLVARPLDQPVDDNTRQRVVELQAHIDAAMEEDQQP